MSTKAKKTHSYRARVIVVPRPEILDPQGKAICDVLSRSGYKGVEEVRAGKSFDLKIEAGGIREARAQLKEMSEKLLSNPIVEDFEVVSVEAAK